MQGRTRGFFEDVFVLAILVSFGWGGYMFFFSEENISSSTTTPTQLQSTEQNIKPQKQTPTQEHQDKTVNIISQEITDSEIIKQDKSENSPSKEVKKEEIQKKEENKVTENVNITKVTSVIQTESKQAVDIEKLQKFLIETKQKIKQSILPTKENNQNLSIRVTVLKDGSYEQLIYTGGSKELFKNNYENIRAVFPLEIDESILGDFPRYLRYSYRFSVKEE